MEWQISSSQRALRLVLGPGINFNDVYDSFSNHLAQEGGPAQRILLRLGFWGAGITHQQAYASLCLQLLEQRPSLVLWARHLYPNLRDAIVGSDERWASRLLARYLRTLFLTPRRGPTYCLIYLSPGTSGYKEIIAELKNLMAESEILFRLLIITESKAEEDDAVLCSLPCVDLPSQGNNGFPEEEPKGRLGAQNMTDMVTHPHDVTESSIQKLSKCVNTSMNWMLRALAWAAFSIRPLSDIEMEEAVVIASDDEERLLLSRPTKALLVALEFEFPGLFCVTKDGIWTAPELSSHLRSVWPGYFGAGHTPERYLSRCCFTFVSSCFQTGLQIDTAQQHPAILQYSIEYWMEHLIREIPAGRDRGGSIEKVAALLKESPGFGLNAWIRHLCASHWSASISDEVRAKFYPDEIRGIFGIGLSDACYISYRMSILPLNTEDNFYSVMFGIASKYLSEDTFVTMFLTALKTPSAVNNKSSVLRRVLAGAKCHVSEHLIAISDVSEFAHQNFVDILLTAIAIGNTSTVKSYLAKAPQYSLGYNGEKRPASGLGTALQVACEYGDGEIVEQILGDYHDLDPQALEMSYPCDALHITCILGHSPLVEVIGHQHKTRGLNMITPARCNPLLVTSARGLYKISEALKTVFLDTEVPEDTTTSPVEIASKFGYPCTLGSLFTDHNRKISHQIGEMSAAVLVSRSGNDEAAILVHRKFIQETIGAFQNLLSESVELGTQDSRENDDSCTNDDNYARKDSDFNRLVEKSDEIVKQALLAMVESKNLQTETFENLLSYLVDPSKITDSRDRTLLLLAARVGALEFVKRLHIPRDNPEVDKYGQTAMHLVCYYGHLAIVEFLLQAEGVEYSLTTRNADSETPVTAAAIGGHLKIVEILLPLLSPEDLRAEFTLATQKDLLGAMKLILRAAATMDSSGRAEYVHTKNEDGFTPLQLASSHNQPRIIQFLLLRQPDLDEGKSGTTALGFAATQSGIESMRLLLDAGASPEVRGRSTLSESIYWERPEPVRLLLEYGAPTRLSHIWNYYNSILEFTLSRSSPAVLTVLLKHFEKLRKNIKAGPVPEEMVPKQIFGFVVKSADASMFAAVRQAWPGEVFDSVIRESEFEFGMVFENAAVKGTPEALQQIYKDLGDRVNINDTKGLFGTALQAAAASTVDALVKVNMLIEWGARAGGYCTGYWGTALHAAAFYRNRDIARALVSMDTDNGLEDLPDRMGRLPLHLAAMVNDWETVVLLSTEKSTPNSEDHQGRNSLHMACGQGHAQVVEELLNWTADPNELVNKPDIDGWTPLHWACRSKNNSLVESLLSRGACPSKAAKMPQGWLPYHVAVHYEWEMGEVPQRIKDAWDENQGTGGDDPSLSSQSLYAFAYCDCCRCVSVPLNLPVTRARQNTKN